MLLPLYTTTIKLKTHKISLIFKRSISEALLAMGTNSTIHPDDPVTTTNLIFGSVGLLACLSGIVLNILSVSAFYKTIQHISNKFYLMMVVTDIATSLSMIPFCVSRLHNGQSKLYSNVVVCNTAGVLFSLGSQLSVLSVALQSIIRTKSLLFPLRELKLLPLKIFCIFYCLAQILIAALPFMVGKKYRYYSSVTSCNFSLRERWDSDSLAYKVILMLVGILPFLWPAIPILISCFISVFILLVRDRSMGDETTHARCRHASVTIVIVTVLYIVLNIPYWNYLLFWLVDFKKAATWFAANDPNNYLYAFLNPFSMLLNSGINPVIYLIRMRRVRENIVLLCKFRNKTRLDGRTEVVGGIRLLDVSETDSVPRRRASAGIKPTGTGTGRFTIPTRSKTLQYMRLNQRAGSPRRSNSCSNTQSNLPKIEGKPLRQRHLMSKEIENSQKSLNSKL